MNVCDVPGCIVWSFDTLMDFECCVFIFISVLQNVKGIETYNTRLFKEIIGDHVTYVLRLASATTTG